MKEMDTLFIDKKIKRKPKIYTQMQNLQNIKIPIRKITFITPIIFI